MTAVCSHCKADIMEEDRFCAQCGTRVASPPSSVAIQNAVATATPSCSGCGKALTLADRFCPLCGVAVGQSVSDAAMPATYQQGKPAASSASIPFASSARSRQIGWGLAAAMLLGSLMQAYGRDQANGPYGPAGTRNEAFVRSDYGIQGRSHSSNGPSPEDLERTQSLGIGMLLWGMEQATPSEEEQEREEQQKRENDAGVRQRNLDRQTEQESHP